ncbi:hypothetical protein [Azospirillum sp. B506]|nr:hypothetical protein [Azospirillum sp. B506]
MTLGRYDYERRYRKRVRAGVIKFALLAAFVLGVGLFSNMMEI